MARNFVAGMFRNEYREALQDEEDDEYLEYNSSRPRSTPSGNKLLSKTSRRPYTIYITVAIIFLTSVLAFITWHGFLTSQDGLKPKISYELYTVLQTPANKQEEIWESLETERFGFIYIEHPESYGLPPGLPFSKGQARKKYGLSWGHQLHCLSMIRDELHTSRINWTQPFDGRKAAFPNDDSARRHHHIEHCFDYLRQSIQCASDMTIEWAAPEPDGSGNLYHINGYGVQHRCRNLDEVYKYSADHGVPNSLT